MGAKTPCASLPPPKDPFSLLEPCLPGRRGRPRGSEMGARSASSFGDIQMLGTLEGSRHEPVS